MAIALPGASYLFCWPLFAATMCASWWRRSEGRRVAAPAWLAILAIPALVLFVPLSKALLIALTADMLPFCMLLLALMLSLLVLPLRLTGGLRRWVVAGSLAVSLVALLQAELQSGFNDVRKRPDSLSLLVDSDSSKAWWFSFDHTTDNWTASRLGATPARIDLSGYGFGSRMAPLLATATDANTVGAWTAPSVTTTATVGGRRVRVHVARAGEGQMIRVAMDTGGVVTAMSINGRALQDGMGDRYAPRYHRGESGDILRYFGVPPEGVDLEFTVSGSDSAALRIVSGVPQLPGMPARPAHLMSKPFLPTDMMFMAWTIRI